MEIKFKRFNPQTDIIKPFDCGDSDLNGFLLESNEDVPNATQHTKQLLAVTYIIEDIEAGKTVAYFSLLHDRIERNLADKTIWNRLSRQIPNAKRRRSYPAIKIGRLAVSEEYKGHGFGSKILGLVKQWYSSDNRAGCRYITVDALRSAVDFYQQNHFERLISSDDEEDTVLMYYDLKRFSE